MPSAATAPWDEAAFRDRLHGVLDTFVDEQAARLAPLGADAGRLVAAARDAVTGGKRLRAMFCHWGFRTVRVPRDAAEEQALLRACGALELLHASALVHDDYMDASDTRRGRPAVHRAFEEAHRSAAWRGSPEQYGAAAAILLGDLLLVWADELLRTCGFPTDVVGAALRWFDTTRTEVITGQFLDVSVQARGDADVEQAMRVLRYKSAKYSVERPLHVGAALAGGEPAAFTALSGYGLPLGEAFQLRDDLLGVFGDSSVTGKPAGDDLVEGKRTVLVALALAGLDADEAKLLDTSLGGPLSEDEVERLRGLIERSGAQAEVERRIGALTDECLEALSAPAVAVEAREALRSLALAATQRSV
ncbi:polyprenyl synthetase family protein [Nocardioides caldifontis]|uniref:polyprenyl synthetase family protein n=1 Tax=Nocardioides caldifontis TaxID=2588938 RepID=UPI0011DFD056|nr:polyprenyl synthetase family protein [Nocardioides caldifontis]